MVQTQDAVGARFTLHSCMIKVDGIAFKASIEYVNMSWINTFRKSYRKRSGEHVRRSDRARGLSDAVGGSFDTIGYLEKSLLKMYGLAPDHFLIDVGCGSGRLLSQLTTHDVAQYLGTDISLELLANCEQYLATDAWQLRAVENCEIPSEESTADMVCMFSLITHLLHQQSYLYFQEAARVLKPGGKLIVSFLEFRHPGLWPIFEASISEALSGGRLDTFVDRDALTQWSEHAGFEEVTFIDGEKPHIPIDREIEFDNGLRVTSMSRLGPTGQSIMICQKKV
jgi:SAM-dependent methyltransferase